MISRHHSAENLKSNQSLLAAHYANVYLRYCTYVPSGGGTRHPMVGTRCRASAGGIVL